MDYFNSIAMTIFQWSIFIIVMGTMWGLFLFVISLLRLAITQFNEIRKGEW